MAEQSVTEDTSLTHVHSSGFASEDTALTAPVSQEASQDKDLLQDVGQTTLVASNTSTSVSPTTDTQHPSTQGNTSTGSTTSTLPLLPDLPRMDLSAALQVDDSDVFADDERSLDTDDVPPSISVSPTCMESCPAPDIDMDGEAASHGTEGNMVGTGHEASSSSCMIVSEVSGTSHQSPFDPSDNILSSDEKSLAEQVLDREQLGPEQSELSESVLQDSSDTEHSIDEPPLTQHNNTEIQNVAMEQSEVSCANVQHRQFDVTGIESDEMIGGEDSSGDASLKNCQDTLNEDDSCCKVSHDKENLVRKCSVVLVREDQPVLEKTAGSFSTKSSARMSVKQKVSFVQKKMKPLTVKKKSGKEKSRGNVSVRDCFVDLTSSESRTGIRQLKSKLKQKSPKSNVLPCKRRPVPSSRMLAVKSNSTQLLRDCYVRLDREQPSAAKEYKEPLKRKSSQQGFVLANSQNSDRASRDRLPAQAVTNGQQLTECFVVLNRQQSNRVKERRKPFRNISANYQVSSLPSNRSHRGKQSTDVMGEEQPLKDCFVDLCRQQIETEKSKQQKPFTGEFSTGNSGSFQNHNSPRPCQSRSMFHNTECTFLDNSVRDLNEKEPEVEHRVARTVKGFSSKYRSARPVPVPQPGSLIQQRKRRVFDVSTNPVTVIAHDFALPSCCVVLSRCESSPEKDNVPENIESHMSNSRGGISQIVSGIRTSRTSSKKQALVRLDEEPDENTSLKKCSVVLNPLKESGSSHYTRKFHLAANERAQEISDDFSQRAKEPVVMDCSVVICNPKPFLGKRGRSFKNKVFKVPERREDSSSKDSSAVLLEEHSTGGETADNAGNIQPYKELGSGKGAGQSRKERNNDSSKSLDSPRRRRQRKIPQGQIVGSQSPEQDSVSLHNFEVKDCSVVLVGYKDSTCQRNMKSVKNGTSSSLVRGEMSPVRKKTRLLENKTDPQQSNLQPLSDDLDAEVATTATLMKPSNETEVETEDSDFAQTLSESSHLSRQGADPGLNTDDEQLNFGAGVSGTAVSVPSSSGKRGQSARQKRLGRKRRQDQGVEKVSGESRSSSSGVVFVNEDFYVVVEQSDSEDDKLEESRMKTTEDAIDQDHSVTVGLDETGGHMFMKVTP